MPLGVLLGWRLFYSYATVVSIYFVDPELLPKFEQILILYASNLNTDKYPPCWTWEGQAVIKPGGEQFVTFNLHHEP